MNSVQNNIPNIRCVAAACEQLKIPYKCYDQNHNLIGIFLDQVYYFANASTPFNNHSVVKICKDKQFTYELLRDVIKMPETVGFLNPDCNEHHRKYLTYFSLNEITEAIQSIFPLPVIVKMNQGSQGTNVFLCATSQEIHNALTAIYNKNSHLFDYIALAQQHIKIAREFRVVIYNKKICLAYEKDISNAVYVGNLSPLHYEGSKAVLISDTKLLDRLEKFIQPLFSRLDLCFAGLDIAIDKQDDVWLLELNGSPGFDHFIKDNGEKPLINMYQEILKHVKNTNHGRNN